jgi:hypothetical protein
MVSAHTCQPCLLAKPDISVQTSWGCVVIKTRLPEDDHERLEVIIRRMQKIQRAIKASRQPPSMLELDELMSLGNEYARTVARLAILAQPPQD